MAHFIGAIAGVLAARQILGLRLSDPSVQYMVTVPGKNGNAITFLGEFLLSAAALYVKTVGLNRVYCAKVFHDTRSVCPFRCQFEHVYEET